MAASDPPPQEEPNESPVRDEGADDAPPPRAHASGAAPRDNGRRKALGALVVVGSSAYGAALAVPALGYLRVPAGGAGGERWIRVARFEALPEATPTRAPVIGDERDAFTVSRGQMLGSVWLTRRGGAVTALSAECPHLGCAVDVGGDGKSFGCPCHTSRFSLEGKPESGPSPRAMDALGARVVEGWVEVDFRRYRQGVADKVTIG
jgi:cytochrome b6-f complex iron-sulfur subunit/menaquinol-cytochrome c reductase iron-sulfur subunit